MLKYIKSLFIIGFLGNAQLMFAAGTTETDTINQIGNSGAFVAGTAGIGLVHATFWFPVLMFIIGLGIVVGFYYKQFKQKDDGVYKTIGAFFLGLVVGVVLYVGALKIVDGLFDSSDCGSSIVTAYIKDSVNKGLNPSGYTFGTKIKAVQCISN